MAQATMDELRAVLEEMLMLAAEALQCQIPKDKSLGLSLGLCPLAPGLLA